MSEKKKTIRCKICPDFIPNDADSISDHMGFHTHQMFSCITCRESHFFGLGPSYEFRHEIVEHLQKVHDDILDYGRNVKQPISFRSAQCLTCNDFFLCRIKRIVLHHQAEHPDAEFRLECRVCEFASNDWDEWDDHCEWHQNFVRDNAEKRAKATNRKANPQKNMERIYLKGVTRFASFDEDAGNEEGPPIKAEFAFREVESATSNPPSPIGEKSKGRKSRKTSSSSISSSSTKSSSSNDGSRHSGAGHSKKLHSGNRTEILYQPKPKIPNPYWHLKPFRCNWCHISCPSAFNLQQHFLGKPHRARMNERGDSLKSFACGICHLTLSSDFPSFFDHINSSLHIVALKKSLSQCSNVPSASGTDRVMHPRESHGASTSTNFRETRQSPVRDRFDSKVKSSLKSEASSSPAGRQKVFICKWCNIPCSGATSLQQHFEGKPHLTRMDSRSLSCFTCEICHMDLPTEKSSFVKHIQSSFHKVALKKIVGCYMTTADANKNSVRCLWCDIACSALLNLHEHFLGQNHLKVMNTQGRFLKRFVCPICHQEIRSVDDFQDHIKSSTHCDAVSHLLRKSIDH